METPFLTGNMRIFYFILSLSFLIQDHTGPLQFHSNIMTFFQKGRCESNGSNR